MCKVSSKIRFCTCKASSTEHLKHYWVFCRFVGDRGIHIMGSMIMPYQVDQETEIYNITTLLQRVNDLSAFDIQLNPQEKDRLQLSFECTKEMEGRLTYGFEYNKGRWLEISYNPFEWEEKYHEAQFGMLKSAIRSL